MKPSLHVTSAASKPFPSLRPPARNRGFTLIELLVVIAIISMLIAMMLPALAKARATARSAACLSRQRQIGIAVVAYRADNASYFPVQGVDGMNYLEQLGAYLGDPPDDGRRLTHPDNGPGKNFWLDPAGGYRPGYSSTHIYSHWAAIASGWQVHNYSLSVYFGWWAGDPDRPSPAYPVGTSRRGFSTPAGKHVILGSLKGSNAGRWPRFDFRWVPKVQLFIHPGESTNVLFRDGHASNVGNIHQLRQSYIERRIVLNPERWW